MSEKVYVVMVLFFILLSFLTLAFDVDTEVKNWLKKRAEKRNQSDVSKEAKRTRGSSSADIWEEIMQENQEEIRRELEARRRDEHSWEELRRIRDERINRQEHVRRAREEMEEQRQRRSNTTQGDYVHHYMGSWNMADSPRTTDAAPAAFTVGDIVKLDFPDHERFIHGDYSWQHPRQTTEGMLHGQYVVLKRQHPGAPYLWDVAILNEADCPPAMIGRQLVVRQKCFIKKQPVPAIVYPKKVKLTEGGLPKL